jgi:hypothetical protein
MRSRTGAAVIGADVSSGGLPTTSPAPWRAGLSFCAFSSQFRLEMRAG